VHATAVTVSE